MAEEEKKEAEEQPNEAEGAAEGADDAVQKKGAKFDLGNPAANQKLFLIFMALNAVILLVVAILFFMQYSKKSATVSLADVNNSAEAEHAEAKGEHGGGEHGKEGKKEGEEANGRFMKESFTVNLKDSRGAHFAKVDVEIEVDDDFVKEELRKLTPRIRDFIVVTLSSKTYEQVESVDGRDFLREEIRNKINGYLTRGQIKAVYFTQFIIQ